MEKNENTQKVPQWVKIINDFPAPCQQSIGNLCASVVQNLSMIAMISFELYNSICDEVQASLAPENTSLDCES